MRLFSTAYKLPLLALLTISTGLTIWFTKSVSPFNTRTLSFFSVDLPEFYEGLSLHHYDMEERLVKNNDILGSLLSEFEIPGNQQYNIIEACTKAFNVKQLREGHSFHVFRDKENCKPLWIVYNPGPYKGYKIKLTDKPEVCEIIRPVVTKEVQRSGVIRSSLWNAIKASNLPIPLIMKMESVLECAVDFHHLQAGDHFKVIYEQDFLEDKPIGFGKILAISFSQDNKNHHAIYYEKDTLKGYYDLAGKPMRSMFLKAPIRFSRISSHFSPSRLHPILNVRRPHLGTDYAAPYGTEILAVGDGVVTEATQRGGNGKYVRIRHSRTYETQYLHMQGFAKGIKPGVRVRQGQVIGYVGSTGLATGPHVCFRFWKNGAQVNHMRLHFPDSKPLSEPYLSHYLSYKDIWLSRLNQIPHGSEDILEPDQKDNPVQRSIARP